MAPKIEVIYEAPLGCGEGPHWIEEEKALVFVDIPGAHVLRYDEATGKVTRSVIAGAKDVGFIIPVKGQSGKYVVGIDQKIALLEWDGKDAESVEATEIASVQEEDGNRFNDAKCDRSGRLFAGTMGAEDGPGKVKLNISNLYSLSKDKSLEVKVPGISLANGLTWSLDNSTFYYIDTCELRVDAFDYDISTGAVSNRRPVFDLPANGIESLPDGMTIDVDGNLWVATYKGSKVLHIDPRTQKLIDTLDFPCPNITSVTWGGDNYDVLYVTSSARSSDLEAYPLGGSLFKVTGLGTKGLPNDPVDIDV